MALIFGLDIGTTSIGFAVIDHDHVAATGEIRRLGVRIFPDAREPSGGVPFNQERRSARLRRRQFRRRRARRRLVADLLHEAGMLPAPDSAAWTDAMKQDPYALRKRAWEGDDLSPLEAGRAIYHLAQRRHFKAREVDMLPGGSEFGHEPVEKERHAETEAALKRHGGTLGAWLAERRPGERKRGVHTIRSVVEHEFAVLARFLPPQHREAVREAIFHQRPMFWRLNTLRTCPFIPGARLCPRGAWLSQQKRMLEKLNNLAISGSDARPLDRDERSAILTRLQAQESMTWPAVRRALAPLYATRGEGAALSSLKFNLEEGGEKSLPGNSVEKELAAVFGGGWAAHPCKQQIRDSLHEELWQADYRQLGAQRVIIRPEAERRQRRREVARHFMDRFGVTREQAARLGEIHILPGWDPFSADALRAFMPHLETGVRFAAMLISPQWEKWRDRAFPSRDRPPGEVFDRLPSPASREEAQRIARLRNPTVGRVRNELRKVVNNLIDLFGKPDLVRIEMAREVAWSRHRRGTSAYNFRMQEQRRAKARKGLRENGVAEPSRADIDKWLLWEECGRRCPYTGDSVSFKALFHNREFEVDHIWPRSRSIDNSYANKTLCRADINRDKGNRTPFEYLGDNPEAWKTFANRVERMSAAQGEAGMPPRKIERFLAKSVPETIGARQLHDTSYAARQAVVFLERLWPYSGPAGRGAVQAVSGRVTAHLRTLWSLNGVLSKDGRKTRDDHRHHAIDALVVACTHPGIIQDISRYWAQEEAGAPVRSLSAPWPAIRRDAERAIAGITVSHRVRKKLTGPLHKETVHGVATDLTPKDGQNTQGVFTVRKPLETMSRSELTRIRDERIRRIVRDWVAKHGGNPKKSFPPYPKRGRKGPEIRKARLMMKRQFHLMARVATGYAELGNNHHVAIYRTSEGKTEHEVVSLFEACRRHARKEPVVWRMRNDGARFVMSLAPGDALSFAEPGGAMIRIVEGIWAGGRVVLVDHNDAAGATRTRPTVNSILSNGGRKVSIDPIGRIRPAND